jgi:hypothetical protein
MLEIKDIRAAREKYEREHHTKQVRIPDYIPVRYDALDKLPDISLKYIVGGGIFLTHDYLIVGGPDAGKRVELAYWVPERAIDGKHTEYNGSKEEFETALGYTSRPSIRRAGGDNGLHVATVMFIRGLLHEQRQHSMAKRIDAMYEQMDREQKAAEAA